MSWTDQRIDQLKTLWEKGLTASQIADELGGVSRNAVIGKAHRLGLKSRPSPVKANEPDKKAAPKKAAAAPAKPMVAAAPMRPRPVAPAAPAAAPRADGEAAPEAKVSSMPRIVSIGPGGFMRQGPGDQQAPIPPAPPATGGSIPSGSCSKASAPSANGVPATSAITRSTPPPPSPTAANW